MCLRETNKVTRAGVGRPRMVEDGAPDHVMARGAAFALLIAADATDNAALIV